MDLNTMAKLAYENSKAKGFWDEHPEDKLSAETVAAKLALIHSEVSEALEDIRDGKRTTYLAENGKPCGFSSELADILIRLGDLAYKMKIDLNEETIFKMDYNRSRPHKHGKTI